MTNNTGYPVHHLKSGDGQAILLRYKLTLEDIDQAVKLYNSDGNLRIRTVIGISDDGLIGSEKSGWQPNLPDAFTTGLVMVPWIQMLELLGRVPQNSTEAFLDNKETKQ